MIETTRQSGEDAPALGGAPTGRWERPRRSRFGWGLLLGMLVLIALAAAAAAAYFATHANGVRSVAATTAAVSPALVSTAQTSTVAAVLPAGRVIVPDVTGLKEDRAAARLGAASLKPRVRRKATAKPTGVVVAQAPLSGRQLKMGARVTIIVDQGQPAAVVPDLAGLKVAAAGVRLAKLGLKAQTTPVTAAKPAGSVVSQAPAAGTKLAKDSVVTLSIARPPAPQTPTSAATTTTAATTTVAAVTTAVAANTTAAKPTTAATTTTAAAPAHPSSASVPDLAGHSLADAAAALTQAGLYPNVAYIPGSQPLGTVLAQARPAGTTTRWGSYLRVNVSKGPSPPPNAHVPDVTQQPRTQAMQTLASAGFEVKVLWRPTASNVRNDVVLDEQPNAGSPVPQGALVILIVSKQQGR